MIIRGTKTTTSTSTHAAMTKTRDNFVVRRARFTLCCGVMRLLEGSVQRIFLFKMATEFDKHTHILKPRNHTKERSRPTFVETI